MLKLFYIYLFIFNFLNFTNFINSIVFIEKFLNKNQWCLIDRLLLNPNTSNIMKNKIHYILFKYYDQWAFTKAYKFKQFHRYKCSHISVLELYTYASFGLYKSIKSFRSEYRLSFASYAENIINYELLKGLSDLHPITSVSKSIRKKGYSDKMKHKPSNKIQLIGKNDWIFDKNFKNHFTHNDNTPLDQILETNKYIYLWSKINCLNPFQKRIIYLKYNFYFERIRSNKEVSIMMCCSEEWIRQNIVIIFTNLELLENTLTIL
jgi:RNA polymerase sigma factor (sigma-70 family)